MKREKAIEIPFGAKDSELIKWEYTIPEGMEAEIKDGKVIIKKAESEDERIRKEIIEYLKLVDKGEGDYAHPMVSGWLAWLEKQKEFPMPNSTELIEMWDAEKAMLKEKDFRDDAWRLAYNAFMDGFAKGTCVKFEKQKEQKPAEWNPTNEDVVLFNKAVTTNTNLTPSERAKLDIIRMKFKHCNGQIATNDFDIALGERYIQGYNDGINESKPAEWSEEDELMMKAVIGILDESDHPKLCHWLKSLKPQPKQEWSEEDENARQNLIAHFEGKILKLSGEAKKEAVDWLKSLRPQPHWKPSEGQ